MPYIKNALYSNLLKQLSRLEKDNFEVYRKYEFCQESLDKKRETPFGIKAYYMLLGWLISTLAFILASVIN
jgi:hypothetical protein